jgi:glycopeptide antibiotics resistance protein
MTWKKLIFSKYVVWAYVLVVMLLAVLPLNSNGSLNDITLIQIRGDYWVHAVQFLPFAFLIRFSYRNSYLRSPLPGIILATVGEGIQYFLPWRAFNINDLLANLAGMLAGFMLLFLYEKADAAASR